MQFCSLHFILALYLHCFMIFLQSSFAGDPPSVFKKAFWSACLQWHCLLWPLVRFFVIINSTLANTPTCTSPGWCECIQGWSCKFIWGVGVSGQFIGVPMLQDHTCVLLFLKCSFRCWPPTAALSFKSVQMVYLTWRSCSVTITFCSPLWSSVRDNRNFVDTQNDFWTNLLGLFTWLEDLAVFLWHFVVYYEVMPVSIEIL